MLAQLILNGFVLGSGYALIAVGHTIIFGLMRVSNFAHGELYMLGAYLTYTLVNLLELPFYIGLVAALMGGAIIGYALNRLVFRYVRDDGTVNGLVTIGLSIFLVNIAQYIWGAAPRNIDNPFTGNTFTILGAVVTPARFFIIFMSAAAILVFHCIIKYTKIGKAFRATFQKREAAQLVGINIESIYSLSTVLGTVMACLAGALLGLVYSLEPNMGKKAISVAWSVVVVGGAGNFVGAIVVGYFMGILESLGGGYISSAYKDAFPFIMLVIVLLVKPNGIFSKSGSRMNG